MKKAASFGTIIFALSMAQFIMTVDTTIMNVSVPTLVDDLDTTVGAIQAAITLYALVMASLMLIGGKLGELYGRKKIFQIGLMIYALGSGITAIAPNIVILILGWSILEGVGASLMMPAMMALISVNFKGKDRIKALGVVAGVAGSAAALGPIIGGALSTYASWRYAFVGEVVIAIVTLVLSKSILDSKVLNTGKLDKKGSVLIASGLSIFVFGVLQASTYGWIKAIKPFEIAGYQLNLFGLSIVPFICGIGALLIWWFFANQSNSFKLHKPYLLKVSLLKLISLRQGLNVVLITQLLLGGILFIMPLFLQLVLGFSAIQTGVALLPISIGVISLSVLSPRFTKKFSNINSVRIGQLFVIVGLIWLFVTISNDATALGLAIPFALIGSGIGLIIPLIQTIILGSVKPADSSQASGLNYTYQQLGMSLGTAVIGSILLFSLGGGIVKGLSSSEQFDTDYINQNSVAISSSVEFVSNDQLEEILSQRNFSEAQQSDILAINSESRIRAIKIAIGATIILSLFGLVASNRIKDFYELNLSPQGG